MNGEERLNKYISESGFCSRREADDYIEQGAVMVNKIKGTVGTIVKSTDKVYVNKQLIDIKIKKVYIAFNKPMGITCTTDRNDPTNMIDYIGYPLRIFPIGRIDKDSEGLILLTNDGDIVNRILRAGNAHEKEYIVQVDHKINEVFIEKMGKGVKIHNTITLPCKVDWINQNSFRIVLTQGLNRQIRLMCETLGYEVVALKRSRIMNIGLKGIEVGTYRELTVKEVEGILKATEHSSKTEEASSLGRSRGKKQNKKNPSVRYANDDKKYASKRKGKKKSPIRNKMPKKK